MRMQVTMGRFAMKMNVFMNQIHIQKEAFVFQYIIGAAGRYYMMVF